MSNKTAIGKVHQTKWRCCLESDGNGLKIGLNFHLFWAHRLGNFGKIVHKLQSKLTLSPVQDNGYFRRTQPHLPRQWRSTHGRQHRTLSMDCFNQKNIEYLFVDDPNVFIAGDSLLCLPLPAHCLTLNIYSFSNNWAKFKSSDARTKRVGGRCWVRPWSCW